MPTCHGRTAQMSVCPLLLLVLCALHSLPAGVQAASRFSGFPVDLSFPPSPHTPLPRPALAHLNTTAFDLAACTFTFAQFEEAHSGWATCFNAPEVSVHTCPRHCLQAMRATATADPSLAEVPVPLVLGSGALPCQLVHLPCCYPRRRHRREAGRRNARLSLLSRRLERRRHADGVARPVRRGQCEARRNVEGSASR